MKQITSITSQKRKDRLNIFLDGAFAFGVSYETAVKFGLKTGNALSDEQIELIDVEEGNTAAYERALSYAVKKTVSEKQMKDYLLRNDFSAQVAKTAIEKLKQYGYIDDEAYARAYVNTYRSVRGNIRLRLELGRAGVSDEIIEKVLPDEQSGAIKNCIEKYKRTHGETDRQKLIKYLLYRGFDYEQIYGSIGENENED